MATEKHSVTTLHTVEPEAVSRFAAALGYRDPSGEVPPTFPISFIIETQEKILADPELAFDYSRVVHREQHFSYLRSLRGGDQVSVTTSLQSIDSMRGNAVATFAVDVSVEGEGTVCTAKAVLVSRAAVPA